MIEQHEGAAESGQSSGEAVARPWGSFEVLIEGPSYKVKRLTVKPGHRISLQRHQLRREHWCLVSGLGKVLVGNWSTMLCAGQSVDIPTNAWHRLENGQATDLVVIEVQMGSDLVESDVERIDDDYGRVKFE